MHKGRVGRRSGWCRVALRAAVLLVVSAWLCLVVATHSTLGVHGGGAAHDAEALRLPADAPPTAEARGDEAAALAPPPPPPAVAAAVQGDVRRAAGEATCAELLRGDAAWRGMRYWSEGEVFESPYAYYGPAKKYATFEPDNGGFNNIRMSFETVAVFAHATGRTLVMPPAQRLYLLKQKFGANPKAQHGLDAFLNFTALRKVLDVVDTATFLQRERAGILGERMDAHTFDAIAATAIDAGDGEKEDRNALKDWARRTADLVPKWDPMREALLWGPCSSPDLPWRRLDAPKFTGVAKRRMHHVDQKTAGAPWVHFQANASHGYRVFTHWYTFFLFDDGPTDAYYKRFVRDHLRYNDDIFCAAARVVRAIAQRTGQQAFSAIHVRRGELQYLSVRISAKELNRTLSEWLQPGEVLYVATDEADASFFDPLVASGFKLFFAYDFEDLFAGLDPNARGMVEQVIMAAPPVRTFTGTFFSTFSSYVARLRAYYGHAANTAFYAAPADKRFVMHETKGVPHYPFFNREWDLGWSDMSHGPPTTGRPPPLRLPIERRYEALPQHKVQARYPKEQMDAVHAAERSAKRAAALAAAAAK